MKPGLVKLFLLLMRTALAATGLYFLEIEVKHHSWQLDPQFHKKGRKERGM